MKEKRIILTFLGLLFALLAVCWLAGLSSFIKSAARLAPPEHLRKRDAIVVLTGGSNRIDAGFDLLGKGYGRKLFISGVGRSMDVKKLLKRWKDEPQGNLDCCVVLGFEADNTVGNARETVDWLRREKFHSVYLITANYHISRALLEFREIAPDLDITPFPIIPDRIDLSIWWKDPTTRNLILREYMKYLVVYLRYSVPR